MRRLGVAAAIVAGAHVPGDVSIDPGGCVDAVGLPPAPGGRLAVPGFVDLQVNGFAGVHLADADLGGYRAAARALARTGVSAFLPTFPSPAPDAILPALARAATAIAGAEHLGGARPVGVHLEGPFLASSRRGAHVAAHLQAPSTRLAERWMAVAPVALVTLAPELPGALDLVAWLVERGVAVGIGHTDCDVATATAAFAAGARAHTHVWNAHRPITSRDPGPGAVALIRPDVAPCLIADRVHVAPEVLALSIAAAADRYVVVTDAVAPRAPAAVVDGAVRLPDGTIAGSAGTLDASLRTLVELGRPLLEALAAITSRPADLIHRPDLGRISVRGRADVVVLDEGLGVADVLVGGVSRT